MSVPRSERSASSLYPRHVRADDVIIEVGANVGGGTLLLSRLARMVYSFEPLKYSYAMLKLNTRKCQNVKTFNVGLGNEKGFRVVYMMDSISTSKVASLKKISGYEYEHTEKVRLERLDDVTFETRPTGLIMDCEGYEREALEGARKTLPELKKVLIETHILSNGTKTLSEVKHELSRYSDIFDIDDSFVDSQKMSWIVAKAKTDLA